MEGARSWDAMREWAAGLLEKRTGHDLAEWNRRVVARDPSDEADLRRWLEEQGVTGYAQWLLVRERFGYADFLTATADDLIDGQYEDRVHLRPILDAVVTAAQGLGPVTIQARKTYVALVAPRRTFAVVRATTSRRADLGLRLDGRKPGGRLQDGKLIGSSSVNVRIPLTSVDELDREVLELLEEAYRASS